MVRGRRTMPRERANLDKEGAEAGGVEGGIPEGRRPSRQLLPVRPEK